MPSPTLPLETITGQDLVVALLGVGRRLKARLPQGHIDPAMMFVLHQIQVNGPLRVSELAGCMGLDASTASRHVRNLEDGGYLARTGDPGDRRASRVRLTPKGRGALARHRVPRSKRNRTDRRRRAVVRGTGGFRKHQGAQQGRGLVPRYL